MLVLESKIFQSGCIFVTLWEADENFLFVFDEFDHNSHVEFFGVAEVAFGDGVFSGVLNHENSMADFEVLSRRKVIFLPSTRRAGES